MKLSNTLSGGARVEICFEMHRESRKDQTPVREPKQSRLELTPRQKEVLQLLAEGRTMKETAALLNVSPRTVAFHRYTLMKHFNVRSVSELLRRAIENSIVSL